MIRINLPYCKYPPASKQKQSDRSGEDCLVDQSRPSGVCCQLKDTGDCSSKSLGGLAGHKVCNHARYSFESVWTDCMMGVWCAKCIATTRPQGAAASCSTQQKHTQALLQADLDCLQACLRVVGPVAGCFWTIMVPTCLGTGK